MNIFNWLPTYKKSLWRVARVHVLMSSPEMHDYAFETACQLLDKHIASKVYFASYGNPNAGTTYVEFKMVPTVEDVEIDRFLRDGGVSVDRVEIQAFEGSDAHAEAFALARLIKGSGDEQIMDVVHWLLNMTGFGYTAEIKIHARAINQIAETLAAMEVRGK